MQFVEANTSETFASMMEMTLPQLELAADAVRKFKIHAMGVGLGGSDADSTDAAAPAQNVQSIAAEWNAAFNGWGS